MEQIIRQKFFVLNMFAFELVAKKRSITKRILVIGTQSIKNTPRISDALRWTFSNSILPK